MLADYLKEVNRRLTDERNWFSTQTKDQSFEQIEIDRFEALWRQCNDAMDSIQTLINILETEPAVSTINKCPKCKSKVLSLYAVNEEDFITGNTNSIRRYICSNCIRG